MQKGDSAKLKLLLAGISARLTKNRDFFVQADCTLWFPAKRNLTQSCPVRTRTTRCIFRAATAA